MKEFDPVEAGLDASFRLIDFTGLKGWGCKVPQEKLLKLLGHLQKPQTKDQQPKHASSNEIGIGLDACMQVVNHQSASQSTSVRSPFQTVIWIWCKQRTTFIPWSMTPIEWAGSHATTSSLICMRWASLESIMYRDSLCFSDSVTHRHFLARTWTNSGNTSIKEIKSSYVPVLFSIRHTQVYPHLPQSSCYSRRR